MVQSYGSQDWGGLSGVAEGPSQMRTYMVMGFGIGRPLTPSVGAISWADESSRLNDGCGHGYRPHSLEEFASTFSPRVFLFLREQSCKS